jgi:hypothetical protein
LQEIVGHVSGDGNAHAEDENQKKIELDQEPHAWPSSFQMARLPSAGFLKVVGSNALRKRIWNGHYTTAPRRIEPTLCGW